MPRRPRPTSSDSDGSRSIGTVSTYTRSSSTGPGSRGRASKRARTTTGTTTTGSRSRTVGTVSTHTRSRTTAPSRSRASGSGGSEPSVTSRRDRAREDALYVSAALVGAASLGEYAEFMRGEIAGAENIERGHEQELLDPAISEEDRVTIETLLDHVREVLRDMRLRLIELERRERRALLDAIVRQSQR